ncbi:MAG TPA: protein translocase subunit SecD [Gaiellaceae bacterium]
MASRRSHLTLVALLLAALVGVFFLGWSGSPVHKKLREGLDLQGGLEIVLQAEPPSGHKLTTDDMSVSKNVIESRVNGLGVSDAVVTQQGPNQIVIELPAVHDPAQAAEIIGSTAQLQLFDLETSLVAPSIDASSNPIATSSLFGLLSGIQSQQSGAPTAFYLFNSRTKKLAPKSAGGPFPTLKEMKADQDVRALKPQKAKRVTVTTGTGKKKKTTTKLEQPGKTTKGFPTGYQVMTVPGNREVVTCTAVSSAVCPGLSTGVPPPNVTEYYLFKFQPHAATPVPQMTGNDLKLSGTQQDIDPQSGEPIVTLQFTSKGNGLFHEITRAEAIRGQTLGVPQHFAIVLDGQLRSFPEIDYTQNPDGINPAGTGAEINGLSGISEAKSLALVLRSGALRVPFKTVEQTDVSATLGKDSLKQARNAAIGGLLVVVIFLLLLYRFLGLVAVLGLAFYCALMYGAILLFGVTLTLPGFAGLILTIGVAADANVVVFERIKEEARAGRSVKAAVATGYAKGFRTIVDANVVTCITALVLFAVATAEVKGFALMLLIGTVVSLITAVAATRAMLGLLSGFRWFANPKFMGAAAAQRGRFLQIDFMRRRYLWFAISGAVVVIAASSLAIRGLNLGIDFKGGVQISFSTAKPTSQGVVQRLVAQPGSIVQGTGHATASGEYKSFQIRIKKLQPAAQAALSNKLTNNLHAVKLGVKNVSSSFGRQIAHNAILAIIFSLLLITLYATLRFDWKYAVPVIIAMLHDVVITVGVYSLTGREVTSDTVAAVLTVLGYSIYDTIIIFDRIRENVPIMRAGAFADIANTSLWETIRRSLATTFITLLPVGALLFFGGSTLKDFAFALLIGITSGAYSSIFIAAPILTMWKEREPEFARRKHAPLSERASQRMLDRAEKAAAEEPTPETPVDVIEDAIGAVTDGGDDAKRERRRQRRKTRPHGRAR